MCVRDGVCMGHGSNPGFLVQVCSPSRLQSQLHLTRCMGFQCLACSASGQYTNNRPRSLQSGRETYSYAVGHLQQNHSEQHTSKLLWLLWHQPLYPLVCSGDVPAASLSRNVHPLTCNCWDTHRIYVSVTVANQASADTVTRTAGIEGSTLCKRGTWCSLVRHLWAARVAVDTG